MDFLDLVKIGTSIKINVDLSKDRLNSKTMNAIKENSIFKVKDFRLTDGKGVGVIVELSNGDEEWFFENEIEILDDKGKIIPRIDNTEKNFSFSKLLIKIFFSKASSLGIIFPFLSSISISFSKNHSSSPFENSTITPTPFPSVNRKSFTLKLELSLIALRVLEDNLSFDKLTLIFTKEPILTKSKNSMN